MRLLALVDAPDHVCCRYRVLAFEPDLNRAGGSLACQALSGGTLSRLRQLTQAAQFDSVLLQRRLLPGWQLSWLRRHCRHLVFDFDDAVLFRDSYHHRGAHSARRAARFAATVREADVVIAGNDFLADCALRAGAAPECVRIIPTCVDPALYSQPAPEPGAAPEGGRVDLVWIGSASTLQGLQQQRPLWDRLAREVPGVRMRVICDRFPFFETMPVVPIPWSPDWEARDLAAAQIGVSWLPDDPWSRGKCGLKILQYQAAGLPVVANPVGVQSELIEPGVTGFLPATDDQWIEAVRTLAQDAGLRRRMGRAARRRVESAFSVAAWAGTFLGAVFGGDQARLPAADRGRSAAEGAVPGPRFWLRRGRGRLDLPAAHRFRWTGDRE